MKETDSRKNLSLQERIIKNYPFLSRKEKKIADYLSQNLRTAFVLSTDQLAKNTEISSATVVRFAQHLGFSGFQQLRSQMMDEVKEEMMPEDRFRLLTPDGNQISTVIKIAEQEVENINTTLRHLQQETLKKFIDSLRKGRCVYTIGIGVSSLLARLTAYLLNQAGVTTHVCLKEEHFFLEKLVLLTKKDVILGFSFPPYSKETVEAMKFCFERGMTCLSITDRTTAPIAQWSHGYLLAQTKNLMFTNSLGAVLMIINAIATELALINKKKVVANIDLINKLLEGEFLG